jgi:hypothetical protein
MISSINQITHQQNIDWYKYKLQLCKKGSTAERRMKFLLRKYKTMMLLSKLDLNS